MSRPAALPLALALLLSTPVLPGCLNECSFWARCDGNVLEVCGSGVDQIIGRTIHRTDCGDEGTCLEIDDETAMCAANPVTECDASYEESCDEANAGYLACSSGYLAYVDCLAGETECFEDPEWGAGCQLPCDASYEAECDYNGYGWYFCTEEGYVSWAECPPRTSCADDGEGPACG